MKENLKQIQKAFSCVVPFFNKNSAYNHKMYESECIYFYGDKYNTMYALKIASDGDFANTESLNVFEKWLQKE